MRQSIVLRIVRPRARSTRSFRAAAVAPEALDDESDPQRLRGVGQRFVAVPRRASSAAQRTAVPKPAAFESGACDAPLHPCGVQ